MSQQSNAAAERSAHVTRGSGAVPAEWPVVLLPDGTWQLKAVAERDAEIARLRAVLEKLARLGAEPHYGNSVGNIIARAALGEKK